MKKTSAAAAKASNDEIAALVRTLHQTQQRLVELTHGEVDAVVYARDQSYLLREAQEKLRQSETTQRQLANTQTAILNALPAHIALLDSSGKIVSVNDAWRQFATANLLQGPKFGVGQNYLEICERATGDFSAKARAVAVGIRRLLQGKATDFALEYPCHSPTEQRWFRLMATPVREGRPAGAVVMHSDVSARKIAEEVLRSSEANMAAAQRIAHLGSWELQLDAAKKVDANPLLWSDEMFRIAGFEPGAVEVTNELFFSLVPEIEHEPIRRAVATAIRERKQYSIVHRFIRPNGEERIVHEQAQVFFDKKTGQPLKLFGTTQDITEAKKAEEQLLWKTAFFEAQVNSALDGILVVDNNGQKILQNQRMIDLWNIPDEIAQESGHHRRLEWITGRVKNPRPFAERVAYLYAHPDEISHDELELVDGNVFERYSAPVRSRDGKHFGRIWTYRDITQRKKLEQQFLRSQRMESIGTLAGGIAHDLNNILAPIMMSIQVLKEKTSDANAKGILETIEASAFRGAEVVRQVLSFARGLQGELSKIQPNHLVREFAAIIKETFPKNIRLHLVIPEDILPVLADATQVHQILLNLCLNARDAMPDGGTLSIAVENCILDKHGVVINPQAKAGCYVKISVTDSGTGMKSEVLDKIFEPFFTTKEIGKGTGLGLSTVMAIVKGHEGFVNVYSEPGKGTTFRVYLPVLQVSTPARLQLPKKTGLPRGNGQTILVVDDEAPIRSITKKTLLSFGYRVLTATNGAEARTVYSKHMKQIAVVLTDMAMPVMDGAALILALTKINPKVKIIAASGLRVKANLDVKSKNKVKHFLSKPYAAETLLNALAAVLNPP